MRGCLVSLLLLAAVAAEYNGHDSTEAGAVVTRLDDGKLDQLMQEMQQLKEENQERKVGHREVTEKFAQASAHFEAGMKTVAGKLTTEKQSTAKLSAAMKAVTGKLKTEKQSTAKLSAEVRTLKVCPEFE